MNASESTYIGPVMWLRSDTKVSITLTGVAAFIKLVLNLGV